MTLTGGHVHEFAIRIHEVTTAREKKIYMMYCGKALLSKKMIDRCILPWKHFFPSTFVIYLDTKRGNKYIHYG